MEVFVLGSRDTLIIKGRDAFLDFLNPKISDARDRNRACILMSRFCTCASASTFSFCGEGQISVTELEMALSSAMGQKIVVETISVSNSEAVSQIRRVNPRRLAGNCVFGRYLNGERSRNIDLELVNQFNQCGRFGGFSGKVTEYLSTTQAFIGVEKRVDLFTHSLDVIPLVFIQLLIMGKRKDANKLERLVSKLTKCLPLGEDRNDPSRWFVAVA